MKLVAFFKGYNVDKFYWSMFWVFLKLFLFGFVAAIFDIVQDVEAGYISHSLTANMIFLIMRDACEILFHFAVFNSTNRGY